MAEAPPAWTWESFTAGDGYRWQYRHYPAIGSARAQVVCIHGIQSHAGWYEYSCTRLAREGRDVFFLDRRGSGVNEKARGDAPSFRRLLDDVAEFLRARGEGRGARGEEEGPRDAARGLGFSSPLTPRPSPLSSSPLAPRPSPLFLVGISWGGKLAAALQRRHPGLIDGLALLCPGFKALVRPPLGARLRILGSRLVRPGQRFPVPLDDPELFTATPRWQQFIREDPRSLRQATARLLVESVRLDGYLRFVPRHVRVPVLLLLAEKDRIIDNARTRKFVERFASQDKEIIEYPGAHHTLEFEPDPDRFLDDLGRWLDRHSARRPSL